MSETRRDDETLPPIPDGGLSEAMPEWLRRPPAWRTLPDTEVVQPEPERAGELPPADTSVIDPRAFLADDDLPAWLRRFGEHARSADGTEIAAQADQPVENPDVVDDERPATPVSPLTGPLAASRFVPRAPVVVPAADERQGSARSDGESRPVTRSRQATTTSSRTARRPIHRAAWWQGAQLATLLAIALIIALVVIVILVV